jgi:hypothetical protein
VPVFDKVLSGLCSCQNIFSDMFVLFIPCQISDYNYPCNRVLGNRLNFKQYFAEAMARLTKKVTKQTLPSATGRHGSWARVLSRGHSDAAKLSNGTFLKLYISFSLVHLTQAVPFYAS